MGADVTRCVELAIYIVDRNIFFADLYADRFFGGDVAFRRDTVPVVFTHVLLSPEIPRACP